MGDSLSDFLEEQQEFSESSLARAASPNHDLFSIFEGLEEVAKFPPVTPFDEAEKEDEEVGRLVSQKSTSSSVLQESETDELELPPKKSKRPKLAEDANPDLQPKISHITVERNRRKQMNEHLTALRSLMPCFYVKRGDQASIIGGVVDYINELQQVLQSLEAKKQRKVYSEVLSPRLISPLSPRSKPPLPLSPRLNLPISPRTPQPTTPFKPRLHQSYQLEPSPSSSSSTSTINNDTVNELVANSKSAIAEVEVKFSGPNLLLKTLSSRNIPGQAVRIISALEEMSLEILNVSIGTIDETMFNTFTIKIGIECPLSAEELAHQIQQTFCQLH